MSLDEVRGGAERLIQYLNEKTLSYQTRIGKQRDHYHRAYRISKEEISNDIRELLDLVKNSEDVDIPLGVLTLGKDLIGSSTWVMHCYFEYLKSFIYFSAKNKGISEKNHQHVLRILQQDIPLEETLFAPRDIFQCIFKELIREDEEHDYTAPLAFKKIDTTIILIPGVLNELYRTATFERGVAHLKEEFGVEYYAPKVHGRRGSTHNARLIKKQLEEYIENHPGKKLWLLAHSKGGLDSLHFLRRDPEFIEEHVVGLSTIATPIMGSYHTDNLLVKLFQMLIKLEDIPVYQKIDRGRNLLLKNVPHYLSENFQKNGSNETPSICLKISSTPPWHCEANGMNLTFGCCLQSSYLKMINPMMVSSILSKLIFLPLLTTSIWGWWKDITWWGPDHQCLIKRL